MSGKSYSIREMKSIVDYLTEKNLYSETRGRRMWMDYANSQLTARTWQSLKETFLKRILPDITNPYYRLDAEQILSFKRGVNLTQKDKQLEFRAVNKSNNNDKNEDNDQPGSSKNNNEENATGEDTQCSKIVHNRASTETLILESCYQTAEDIQRDLESSCEEKEKGENKTKPPIKSVRDFIEYTEPLTPMLQEVLDDFATDEECSDTEQPMQIDENYVTPDDVIDDSANPISSQSILNPNRTQNTNKNTTTGEQETVKEAGNEQQLSVNNEEPVKGTDETAFSQLEDVMVLVDEALAKDIDSDLNVQKVTRQSKGASSFESSIPLTDSLLPNNQEAVKNISSFEGHSHSLPTPNGKDDQGYENMKNASIDPNLSNSKTNLISDEESKRKGSEGAISIKSNEEKTNSNEPLNDHTPQGTKSPKKRDVSDSKVHVIHSDSSTSTNDVVLQADYNDNPCLKSVSLYAEQLVTTKYSDSDSNNKENANESKTNENQKNNEAKESKEQSNDGKKESEEPQNHNENTKEKTTEGAGVILLNSRTTSESVDDSELTHRPLARSSLKRQKDKKLASVFGFSNGGVAKSRRMNGRKRTVSHHYVHSDSSDWTSASDSEYVSPPHGRRNRYARKYLKPRSARIMSLEEEGGLFVMLGKKIYPLVKDGEKVKNYVTFLPESDPEDDDSYWKSKYIEERKRTADLKKKLGQSKSNGVMEEKESSVSLSSVASPLIQNRPTLPPSRQESIPGNELMRRDSEVLEKSSKHETLKIKFTKNDQEVQLEGHWQHINPVLAQVVSMLHKEPANKKKPELITCVELSSGNTTPVDARNVTVVHEKINKLESEIFKEIEEKDTDVEKQVPEQQENTQDDKAVGLNTIEPSPEEPSQVTQRKKRGRPRKLSNAVTQSPAKKSKKSSESSDVEDVKAQELLKDLSNEEKLKGSTPKVGRPTRSPRKLDGVIPKAKTPRKKSTVKAPEAPVEVQITPANEEHLEEDEVRYKFPSPGPEEGNKSRKTNKISKESPKKHLPNIASPDSLSRHSVNSSQGYQDSDTSPFNIGIRRKKRLSISTVSIKGRKMQRKQRSRSFPLLKQVNSDQSNSSSSISFKIVRREQSTISSDVYRSDSYQFLMPTRQRLENIVETNNEIDLLTDKIRNLRDEILQVHGNNNKADAASSSNLSLPLSPELSIVENLSVSKNAIAEISDLPTINETENHAALKTCDNKYLMSDVDISMPLMTQHCELQKSYKKHLMAALHNLSDGPNSAGRNLSNNSNMRVSISSESILKNLSAVNIETSDSLDRRLEQLLLESAQKPANQNIEKMEVDTQVKKKSGSKKRCSTPHKKKSLQNIKKVNEEPVVIEEESKVQCSRGGRRSCPPSVNILYCEQNPPDNLQININDETIDITAVTKRKRMKKDVIKVKILRPKDKVQKKKSPKRKRNVSGSSGVNEGENESGVFVQGFEDSGDLIHNHSETCLQIGDCMGESDSVEFIETTTKSIISLNSSSFNSENKENLSENSLESRKTSPVLHCDNARCATNLRDAISEVRSADSGNTVYFTPFASRCNSALTEDLSDEAPVMRPLRPSKWYLISEEESNTNYFDIQDNDTRSYGANLKQIFPITVAVPDLSTITEMSEKNENSQKQSL